MKRSKITMALAALLVVTAAGPVSAAAPSAGAAPQAMTQTAGNGYLGVTIDRVPPAMYAQLDAILPADQGVLIRQVAEGSPAGQAGLKPFDILVGYGDQRLYAPEQLSKLVRSTPPGTRVELEVIREGRRLPLQLTVGALEPPAANAAPGETMPQGWRDRAQGHPRYGFHRPSMSNSRNWESFDAISLEKLADGRYHATIEYLAGDGSKRKMEFEGSRDEIRDQILKQEDLPPLERRQLLSALTARDDWVSPAFPFNQGFFLPPAFIRPPGF